MTFDPQTLSIPEVSYRTARFLGVPLPPCFRIAIITRSLAGWLKPQTGEVTALGDEIALKYVTIRRSVMFAGGCMTDTCCKQISDLVDVTDRCSWIS
jgi:hypothetical protein